jgi:hypothetical protein
VLRKIKKVQSSWFRKLNHTSKMPTPTLIQNVPHDEIKITFYFITIRVQLQIKKNPNKLNTRFRKFQTPNRPYQHDWAEKHYQLHSILNFPGIANREHSLF